MTAPTFGQLLRTFREARNITQEDLAERSSLATVTIGSYERGKRKYPDAATIARLGNALGLLPAERKQLADASRRPRAARKRKISTP